MSNCRVATVESNGLIFYNGRFQPHHDFLALLIQDGIPVVRFRSSATKRLTQAQHLSSHSQEQDLVYI